MLNQLIEKGADVNPQDRDGITPLSNACWTKDPNYTLAKVLIEYGADVNMGGKESYFTSLINACHKGNITLVNYLIEKGADVNLEDSRGLIPLLEACERY